MIFFKDEIKSLKYEINRLNNEITDLENDVIIVKILPQTPSGTKLRVKNKGMLLPNSESRSDLIAIINVEVPNITDINMLVQLKNLGI